MSDRCGSSASGCVAEGLDEIQKKEIRKSQGEKDLLEICPTYEKNSRWGDPHLRVDG